MDQATVSALKKKGVLVTCGYGMGIGGWAIAPFRKSAVVSLDHKSVLPTDAEAALIRSYTEFIIRKIYYPYLVEEILREGVEGHNTTLLVKGPEWPSCGMRGWAYRRMMWTQGPTFYPCRETTKPFPPPWDLIQLFDHIESTIPKRWEEWKADHAAMVGAVLVEN